MGLPKVISAASVVLLLGGIQPASAQTQAKTFALEDALQLCARIQNAADRLACFEELARTAAPDTSANAPREAPPATPTIASALPDASEEGSKSRYMVMRADDYAKEKANAEQTGKRAREVYDAIVLRAWKYGNGEYHIALTNGEIWKSQASDNPRPVKDGEKVELQPGAVGGWFMRFKTLKRPTIRVTLVE